MLLPNERMKLPVIRRGKLLASAIIIQPTMAIALQTINDHFLPIASAKGPPANGPRKLASKVTLTVGKNYNVISIIVKIPNESFDYQTMRIALHQVGQ